MPYGAKVFIAAVVAECRCQGACDVATADETALTRAYGMFKFDTLNVEPDSAHKSVNPDGWKATQLAWLANLGTRFHPCPVEIASRL